MSRSIIKTGEHACGAELLRMAWENDAEGIVPGALYKRAAHRAVGRPSVVLGAGSRRYYFVRVESDLTEKQRLILDWICQFEAEHCWMPSIRQIGAEFGIKSTNGVNDHLKAIARKGYIKRGAATARGMIIVRDASNRPAQTWKARALAAEAEVARLQALLSERAAA